MRRGNYAVTMAVAIPALLGLAAFSVDVAYIRYVQAQCQDVADAASTAGMYTLRNERSRAAAIRSANATCAANEVAGRPPACSDIQFGEYADGRFIAGSLSSAMQVEVSRTGGDAPGLFFSRIWGRRNFDVAAIAVAAARPLEIVVVVDITISWHPNDFTLARTAVVGMLDTLSMTAGSDDRIGLVVFNGSLGFEYTPMLDLTDEGAVAAARASWSALALASFAGDPADCPWPTRCNNYRYADEKLDDFDDPEGGFYPNMPRNYSSEPATDYYPGLLVAEQMFAEGSRSAFRAMVVITDGQPYQVRSNNQSARDAAGHVETRWRFARGPVPHSKTEIVNDTISKAADMWDFGRVHTWVISFVRDNADLAAAAQGQGYYERITDPYDLVTSMQAIAESLPIVITD